MLNNADRITGVVVVLGSLLLLATIPNIEINPNQSTLSARFFPFSVAAILLILGAILCFTKNSDSVASALAPLLNRRVLPIAGLILVYYIGFRFVDYRLSTWLFTLLGMWFLGSRRSWELILVPIFTSALVYLLFRHGFTVLLPTWT
jgi:putative tricarboxylic transport membrane protein